MVLRSKMDVVEVVVDDTANADLFMANLIEVVDTSIVFSKIVYLDTLRNFSLSR